MTATRIKRRKQEELKQQTFVQWGNLAGDLQFHVALFFVIDDALSFLLTSKVASPLMNEIWKPRLETHFSLDISRLERMGKAKTHFVSEYKRCVMRDYVIPDDFRQRDPENKPLPMRSELLLTLFKEGKLEDIKKQNPPVTLETLFNICDSQGRCVIQWAGINGHQAILDYFYQEALKQYSDDMEINQCTGFLNAPRIYWVACFNQIDVLEKMLEAKEVNVNARMELFLETPLHIAAYMGNSRIVSKLLDAKADVNVQDDYGTTLCHEAAYAGNHDVVELLAVAKADINSATQRSEYIWGDFRQTPLMRASQRGNYKVASLLLKLGVQVNDATNTGKTALWRAVELGQQEMLPLLLDAKSNVNIVDDTSRGESLIHIAALRGDVFSAKLLIENKADVNVGNQSGYTPLASAALHGYPRMVRTLLDAGAKWPYGSEFHTTYIFDQHTQVKPEIKKMLVIAEINQHLAKIPVSDSSLLFSLTGLFSVKYKEALQQLKSAVERDADLGTFQSIKRWYPVVFLRKEYNDIYNRACSIVNPAAAECELPCYTRSRWS